MLARGALNVFDDFLAGALRCLSHLPLYGNFVSRPIVAVRSGQLRRNAASLKRASIADAAIRWCRWPPSGQSGLSPRSFEQPVSRIFQRRENVLDQTKEVIPGMNFVPRLAIFFRRHHIC